MKAVVYDAYCETPTVREVSDPGCPPGGVVLAVRASGVCRSDWHAWQGHDPVPLPHIPGHELAGVVAEVGAGVTSWRVGDRVTVPFVCGCGRCEYCRAGDSQVCPYQTQPGFTGPGSFAERVAIEAAEHNLVRLPDSLGFLAAAALGCRFATAYRAVTVHGHPRPGEWLAVHGCGGVGLSAVMIAAAAGARVIAADISSPALSRARDLGAEVTIIAGSEQDPVSAIREITSGGAHVSIDALGSAETAVASVNCLRRRGRHVQVGLLLAAAVPALPLSSVIAYELELYGSHGMAAHEYPAMLALVSNGTLRPGELLGRVVTLEEVGAALEGMNRADSPAGMTVVDLTT